MATLMFFTMSREVYVDNFGRAIAHDLPFARVSWPSTMLSTIMIYICSFAAALISFSRANNLFTALASDNVLPRCDQFLLVKSKFNVQFKILLIGALLAIFFAIIDARNVIYDVIGLLIS